MNHNVKKALRAMACGAGGATILLTLAGGCTGYRVGSTLPPGVRSIYVPAIINQCGEPQAELEATRATIQEFQKDGNLWIRPEDQADAVLKVTLVKYSLEPLRFDRNSGKTAQEYRVILSAQYTLAYKKSGQVLNGKKVQGDATFEFSGDLTSARARALPLAAQNLAQNLVDSVVSYW